MEYLAEALNFLHNKYPEAVEEARKLAMTSGKAPELVRESTGGGHAPPPESAFEDRAILEAVIHSKIRPPLLVQNGYYVRPTTMISQVSAALDRFENTSTLSANIRRAIGLSGQVVFVNHERLGPLGTGWIVRRLAEDEAIVVTNRHVAEEFAKPDNQGGYVFRRNRWENTPYRLILGLLNEYRNPDRWNADVLQVLHIVPDDGPDVALVRVKGDGIARALAAEAGALAISDRLTFGRPSAEARLGLVGYPSTPNDASPADLAEYFDGTFHVKRFSFGEAMRLDEAAHCFTHDMTTLGGSSGSMVFDIDTGSVVGLHFAGRDYAANYAVNGDLVGQIVEGLDARLVAVPAGLPPLEKASAPGRFRGRDGYDPAFLGAALPPPGPGQHPLARAVSDDDGQMVTELKYRHFSVWMHQDRLLPVITAVNINGMEAKRLGRTDEWLTDHRLPVMAQVDNAGYKNNPLDRGHMVRREDPVWGDLAIAEEANLDTFFYTNAAPQHEGLNQKDWLALEDYILGAARARGLRVSVFTGPVFRDDDPPYRDLVRIPCAFWKIAALVDDETGRLSVTGYLLSQASLIADMPREFAYGDLLINGVTCQMRVAEIGRLAGLQVDHLVAHDPLEAAQGQAESSGPRLVRGPGDLVLQAPEPIDPDEDAAVAEMLANREAEELTVPRAEATSAPADWRDVISDRGYQLCVKWETGGKAYYQNKIKGRPIWPGYASGITIGCGYDLGHHLPGQITADWGQRIPKAALDRLIPCSGFRTVEPDRDAKVKRAMALVKALADIVVPWDVAIAQFDTSKMPQLVGDLYDALDHIDRLHPHCRSALLSLVFNRGNGGFKLAGDRYRELREIRRLMANGTAAEFAKIPALLRSMKRIWGAASSLSHRREDEALLFEAGLAEQGLNEAAAFVTEAVSEAEGLLTERHDDLPASSDPDEEDISLLPIAESGSYQLKDVAWAANDAEQPDYRHLPGRDQAKAFSLQAPHLERLIRWNSFAPLPGVLVFALRGVKIAGAEKREDVASLDLVETRPNHRDFRCVIGVLNRDTGRLWAYRASTVPNAGSVLQCYRLAQAGQTMIGNILPTGCYTYTVGTHKAGHPTREIRGVLRLSQSAMGASEVVVLRSKSDVTYDRYDYRHAWAPADNIHPGRFSTGFSSEGCLTLPGNYVMAEKRHTGLWRDFRKALGLGEVSATSENGRQFSTIVLTGRDAAMAVETPEAEASEMQRLRFGSQGAGVAALQGWLGLTPDSSQKFGPVTGMALVRRQMQTLGWSDGIWSEEMRLLLGGMS